MRQRNDQWKEEGINAAHLTAVSLLNLPQPPQPPAATILISQPPLTPTPRPCTSKKDYNLLKAQVKISIFLALFELRYIHFFGGHNAIVHLAGHHSVNTKFYRHRRQQSSCDSFIQCLLYCGGLMGQPTYLRGLILFFSPRYPGM